MTFYLPIWTWLKSCVGFVVLGYFLPQLSNRCHLKNMSNTLARSLEKMNKYEAGRCASTKSRVSCRFYIIVQCLYSNFLSSLSSLSRHYWSHSGSPLLLLVLCQLKSLPRKQSRTAGGRGLGSPLTRHTLTSQSTWVPHKLSPDPFHAKIPSLDYLLCRYQCQRTF